MAKDAKRLLRSKNDRMIAGICTGLAKYFEIDPVVVRLVWLLITVFTGFFPGLIVYILAILVIPSEK